MTLVYKYLHRMASPYLVTLCGSIIISSWSVSMHMGKGWLTVVWKCHCDTSKNIWCICPYDLECAAVELHVQELSIISFKKNLKNYLFMSSDQAQLTRRWKAILRIRQAEFRNLPKATKPAWSTGFSHSSDRDSSTTSRHQPLPMSEELSSLKG